MDYKQLAEGELGVAEEYFVHTQEADIRSRDAIGKATAYALLGILEQLTKLNTIAEEELITGQTNG